MVKLETQECVNQSSTKPSTQSSQPNQWELRVRFIAAVQENDLTTARSILDEHYHAGRFEPDECYSAEESKSAMSLAVERGYPEMVQLLISFGASVNRYVSGFSPLHYAAANGSVEIVNALIRERANVTAISITGYTPLQLAAQTKSHETVEALILAGAKIEKTDPSGRTPLAIAAANNRYENAKVLIEHGADVNTIDKDGNTPLIHSIDQSYTINPLLVKLLLDSGANPDHMNNGGQIALVTAVRRCSESNLDGQFAIKELIEHNCSIDFPETGLFGENAMHSAISRGQDRIVEMLVRAGANISVRHYGFSPLERLASFGNTHMVEMILAVGAKPEMCKSAWEHVTCHRKAQFSTIQRLVNEWSKIPSLKRLCRMRLRRHWGRNADNIVAHKLFIPSSVQRFLLLLDI